MSIIRGLMAVVAAGALSFPTNPPPTVATATRQYTAYTTRSQTSAPASPKPGVTAIQAGTDSGGTTVDLETGHATYTFKTVLPANYDASKTTTLGMYATRNLTDPFITGK